jgi:hypothetical protein
MNLDLQNLSPVMYKASLVILDVVHAHLPATRVKAARLHRKTLCSGRSICERL